MLFCMDSESLDASSRPENLLCSVCKDEDVRLDKTKADKWKNISRLDYDKWGLEFNEMVWYKTSTKHFGTVIKEEKEEPNLSAMGIAATVLPEGGEWICAYCRVSPLLADRRGHFCLS